MNKLKSHTKSFKSLYVIKCGSFEVYGSQVRILFANTLSFGQETNSGTGNCALCDISPMADDKSGYSLVCLDLYVIPFEHVKNNTYTFFWFPPYH